MASKKFDACYMQAWEHVKFTPGVLRNTTYDETQRRVIGPSGCVAQYNAEHLKTKRPASTARSLSVPVKQPFNAEKFNFLKCKQEEIIVKLAISPSFSETVVTYAADRGALSPCPDGYDEHAWFINVNPLLPGHGLLTPYVEERNPQVMKARFIKVALAACAMSEGGDLRIGFNSLGAWASVNHLHWHTFYVSEVFGKAGMPIEYADKTVIASSTRTLEDGDVRLTVSDLVGWPLRGFELRAESATGSTASVGSAQVVSLIANAAGALCEKLVEDDVAHNLLVSANGSCIYILPRQKQRGGGAEDNEMAIALAESCGLGIVYTEDDFRTLDDTTYAEIARSFALSEEQHSRYRDSWADIIKTASV